jgi:hypothetical protein
MRVVQLAYTTLAAGFSAWVPVNYLQANFNVAFAVLPSPAATGQSFSVQYTMDDQTNAPTSMRPVNYTQAANTVTITDGTYQANPASPEALPHGLTTGDSVTITQTGVSVPGGFTNFDGTYTVTVTSPTVYTITVTPSQTVANGTAQVIRARIFTSTSIPAASAARIAANLTQPCTAVRLAVAALTAGSLEFIVIQGVD